MIQLFKEKLLADLKNKSWKPIYFLAGEETYFIEKTSVFIEKNLLSIEEKLFDQFIFQGDQITPQELLLHLLRFPTLGRYVLIIIKEAQKLAKIEELISYFEKPNPSTVLVICYKNKTLDKKKEIYKILKKNNWIFEFKKFYQSQIPSWIEEKVISLGYKIQTKASDLLAQHIGNDLFSLESQLIKLILSLKKGEEITSQLIQEQIGINRSYNPFELQKALSKKDFSKVFKIVFYLLKNSKEYPLVFILGMLYNFFTKLLCYHALMPNNELTIAKEMGISLYFIEQYKEGYQNYSLMEILTILSEITTSDAYSKGIDCPFIKEEEILKELFLKIFIAQKINY